MVSACAVDGGKESQPQVLDVSVEKAVMRGEIPLHFTLVDSGAYALQVSVEYRYGGGDWQTATPTADAGSGSGFSAGLAGVDHVFMWDSQADTDDFAGKVRLRVRAANPFNSAQARSPEFSLANDNAEPLAFFAGIEKQDDNMVLVRLATTDAEEEPLSVQLEYSIDGGEVWRDATISGESTGLLNSESHGLHTLHWDSAADIAYADYPAVRLRVRAFDELGAGPIRLSDVFSVANLVETRLEIAAINSTQRGISGIPFDIYGNPESRYALKVEFSSDGGETYNVCSQFISRADMTRNLSGLPEGSRHVFFWDGKADLGEKKRRDVLLRLTLLDYRGKPLDPEIKQVSDTFSVDNAALTDLPIISEVYMGVETGGGFIELYATPGYDFSGMNITEIDQMGFPTEAVFALDGLIAPEDGIMVLAGPDGPEADFEIVDFARMFEERRVSNILLQKPELNYIYDALGYGDFGDNVFMGEGAPALYPPVGMSLQRDFTNTDMDDNSLDFILAEPTPGSGNLWYE